MRGKRGKGLIDLAKFRLSIGSLEHSLFKLPPQVTLEILLLLRSQHEYVPLSNFFDQISATPPTIRQRISDLKRLDLVESIDDLSDHRRKFLQLTSSGEALTDSYLNAIKDSVGKLKR